MMSIRFVMAGNRSKPACETPDCVRGWIFPGHRTTIKSTQSWPENAFWHVSTVKKDCEESQLFLTGASRLWPCQTHEELMNSLSSPATRSGQKQRCDALRCMEATFPRR